MEETDNSERLNKEAPWLSAVLKEMKEGLDMLRSKVQALTAKVREDHFPTADGISYLEAKHLLLLNYCQSLVYYLLRKAKGLSIEGHPVVRSLVEIRLFLEKVRPIDKKLQYQIQKLTKVTAGAVDKVGSSEKEEDATQKTDDLLKYRPNPDMLVSKINTSHEDASGVYRPPKFAPTSMEEDKVKASLGVGLLGGYCCCIFVFLFLFFTTFSASFLPIGIHPLDNKYYASEVIKCKDGSKSLTRDRINDDFCDCLDGTDEPGTSACPTGKFYCKNVGSTPQFLFSSRVNDQFCDCCDGSDEYDGSIICFNTCVMGGNVAYETINYKSTTAVDDVKVTEKGIISEDSTQKLKGLKIFIILQAILISFVVAFGLFRRRVKLRRRHIHRPSLT